MQHPANSALVWEGTIPDLWSMIQSNVQAVLGPTNTGKTHLAVERLCAHSSGIIGFPLRLLAREVYDRVRAIKGDARVALITGEERIEPPDARWFVCTTESMPVDRDVAFVAIDEAQLGADRERGHVFTDRILNARGREETLVLGSDSIRPVVSALVPGIAITGRPRFSRLSYAGAKKLTRLPRRSAIVAFSAEDVYSIAELVRRTHGGAAVVMGALSPRTRNRQVDMFQSGEVDYLVATDAIGMGLNMDVGHIAFASLAKFDGTRHRRLHIAEMAQIAGRAGRHQRDGTFGIISSGNAAGGFQPEEIERIEEHRFRPLESLFWRESAPDFSSLDALVGSLESPPQHPALRIAPEALDLAVLKRLCSDGETLARLDGHDGVERLWEVCGLPDFRQTGADFHARLVARLFGWLHRPEGRIPEQVIAGELSRLDSVQGDISSITGRIAAIRTWAYACQRPDWVQSARHWAERTREVEDRLSDALHMKLAQRFVDRRTTMLVRSVGWSPEALSVEFGEDHGVLVEDTLIGRLKGLSFSVEPHTRLAERKQLMAAAQRVLAQELSRRAAALVNAGDAEFSLHTCYGEAVEIVWNGSPVAGLARRGAHPVPFARLKISPDTPAIGEARQIEARLDRWLSGLRARRLFALDQLSAAAGEAGADAGLRSLLAMLVGNGGHLDRAAISETLSGLSPRDRKSLKALGVIVGALDVFHPALLKPESVRVRLALDAAREGRTMPALPMPGLTILDRPAPDLAAGGAAAGFRAFGSQMVRIDIVERIARALHEQRAGGSPFPLDSSFAVSLGIGQETLVRILRALGFRQAAGQPGRDLWRWRGQPRPRSGAPRAANPSFAALGAWGARRH
jgi:ATP-dependent RNA helicase SUPV3L1/SUV3